MKLAILAACTVAAVAFATPAHADPAPPWACGAPGTPPCAAPGNPQTMCAIIAWRTFTPCNWWGVQVPQGTPGSLG